MIQASNFSSPNQKTLEKIWIHVKELLLTAAKNKCIYYLTGEQWELGSK